MTESIVSSRFSMVSLTASPTGLADRIAGLAGAGVLALTTVAGAADDCSDAEPVVAGQVVDLDTTAATPSPVRFDPALCGGTFFTGLGPDLWFRIDLATAGTLRLSTCDADGFDTDLSLHVGSCDAPEMIACNGDGPTDPACQPRHSVLVVEIDAAATHLIRVGGFDGAVGTGSLSIEFDPDCPGDLDGDGRVGGGDLGLIFVGWGDCPGCLADLDGDGRVGGGDLGLLFVRWGECG